MQQNQHFQKFRECIRQLFKMNILIKSSSTAKQIINGFNLTPAEFFRPFGIISHDKKIKIRTINGKEKLIPDFSLNFLDFEEYQTVPKAKIEETIKEAIALNPPSIEQTQNINFENQREIEKHFNDNKPAVYEACSNLIFDFTKYFHDINYIDQPFSIIYLISSEEKDFLNELSNLMAETVKMMSSSLIINSFDISTIPKMIFLLYDSKKGKAEEIFAKSNDIRNKYPGFYFKLLTINSDEETYFDLWSPYIFRKYFIKLNQAQNNNKIGCNLSEKEKDHIFDSFIEIILKIIVPYIENKIGSLDASITLNKKGIRNTVKNLFKKNEKVSDPNSYQMNFSESATRNLADILFLIQDYEQAIQIYKSSSSDFKNKTNKHYANTIEMQIYSTIMNEPNLSKKELDQMFENYELAFNQYATSQENLRFAARTLIFEIFSFYIYNRFSKDLIKFVYECSHNFKECFPPLYPIFMEQYARLNLKLKPVQFRKYCLNLIFAGNKYNQLGFKKNALKCMLLTNPFYNDTKWHVINEYSLLSISRLFTDIKLYSQSLVFQKFALNEAKSLDSIEKSNNILHELSKSLKYLENDRKNGILSESDHQKILNESGRIFLPRINEETVDIILEFDKYFLKNEKKINYLKPIAKLLKSQIKPANEDGLKWIELFESTNSKIKDPKYQLSMSNNLRDKTIMRLYDTHSLEEKNQLFNRKERYCYVEEGIYVVFTFENPLKVSLDLKNIKLIYQFDNDDLIREPTELIEYKNEKITINQQSNDIEFSLKIIPKATGKLKIIGLEWNIFSLNTQNNFSFIGRKLKDGKSYEKNLKNIFEVLPKCSNLLITFINYEEEIYFQEIRSLNLDLQNSGSQIIEKIFLTTSHPSFFGFAFKELDCCPLEPNNLQKINLQLRGTKLEKTEIKILITYILQENIRKYVRIVLPIKVIPSFNIAAFPCTLGNEKIVNLDIENQIINESRQIGQSINLLDEEIPFGEQNLNIEWVTILSKNWEFSKKPTLDNNQTKKNHILMVKKKNFDSKQKEIIDLIDENLEEPSPGCSASPNLNLIKNIEKIKCIKLNDPSSSAMFSKTSNGLVSEEMLNSVVSFINEDIAYLFKKQWHHNFDFYHPDLISFAVGWSFVKKNGNIANGVSTLLKIITNQDLMNSIISSSSLFDYNPVRINLQLNNYEIKHDFITNPVCKVPIKIEIKNFSYPEKISFKIELFNSDESFKHQIDVNIPFFCWEGLTEREIIDLQKDNSITLNLNALFFDYGLYDVLRVCVTFFRNKTTKENIRPGMLRNLLGAENFETRSYLMNNQESFIKIIMR